MKMKGSLRISLICTLGCAMTGLIYGAIRAQAERREIAENLKRTFSQRVDYSCAEFTPVVSPINETSEH
jgi:hypothetical protein